MIASVSACAGVSAGVRGRANRLRAASSASGCEDSDQPPAELSQHEARAPARS